MSPRDDRAAPDPAALERSPVRGGGDPGRTDGTADRDGGGEPAPEATDAEARRRGGEAVWRADQDRVRSRLAAEGSGPHNPEDAVTGSLPDLDGAKADDGPEGESDAPGARHRAGRSGGSSRPDRGDRPLGSAESAPAVGSDEAAPVGGRGVAGP